MNQFPRSPRSLREESPRRRKTRQTRQNRWRRLLLEMLEDRGLLAAVDATAPGEQALRAAVVGQESGVRGQLSVRLCLTQLPSVWLCLTQCLPGGA